MCCPTAPVSRLMALAFGEKIKLSTILCLVMATVGVLLLYYTGDGGTLSLIGTVAVIVGILFFGEGMTVREAVGIFMILFAVTLVVGRK